MSYDEIDPPIKGQKYCLLSFVNDEKNKTSLKGIKIRGVFNTIEEAKNYIKVLQQHDKYFHIYLGEVGKWLPFNPDPYNERYVKDVEFRDKRLQELIEGYKENRDKAAEELNTRMTETLKEVNGKELPLKERLKLKLDQFKDQRTGNKTTTKESAEKVLNQLNELEELVNNLDNN